MTLIKIRLNEAKDGILTTYEFGNVQKLKDFAIKKGGSGSGIKKTLVDNPLKKKVEEKKEEGK